MSNLRALENRVVKTGPFAQFARLQRLGSACDDARRQLRRGGGSGGGVWAGQRKKGIDRRSAQTPPKSSGKTVGTRQRRFLCGQKKAFRVTFQLHVDKNWRLYVHLRSSPGLSSITHSRVYDGLTRKVACSWVLIHFCSDCRRIAFDRPFHLDFYRLIAVIDHRYLRFDLDLVVGGAEKFLGVFLPVHVALRLCDPDLRRFGDSYLAGSARGGVGQYVLTDGLQTVVAGKAG